jgi:hypothetical protein
MYSFYFPEFLPLMEVSGGAESVTDSIRTGACDEHSQSQNHYWSFRRGDELIILSGVSTTGSLEPSSRSGGPF